jgi:signal transduction histidine kinase/CheY-like chemotaxis protein
MTDTTLSPRPDAAGDSIRQTTAELQSDSVRVLAVWSSIVAYLWLAFNIWADYIASGRSALVSQPSWAGALVLLLAALAVYILGRRAKPRLARPDPARYVLAWGILAAALLAASAFTAPGIHYVLIIPITVAGVLLGGRGFAALALAALAGNLLIFQLQGTAGVEAWLSTALLALITGTTALSVNNLRTALAWVWRGYDQAQENEEIAQARAAELQRALKALDEATYRIERSNYMLALARDQAEEARRLKQQFVQNISHELRTPLNLIVGFTELMTRSPEYYGRSLAPAYLRDLTIVYRNAQHLQTMVNDVLDLARLDTAQVSVTREPVDPALLVQETVETARSLVESAGLALSVETEPDLPTLHIDPTRIRQVLLNLLNNATRFTEHGGITVRVARGGDDVHFAVSDTGVGIPPEQAARVFEEFNQVDGGTRRRHGGTGLGLAISKRFVELHDGRIALQSTPGQGSTFTFSLPVEAHGPLPLPGAHPPSEIRQEPLVLIATRSQRGAGALGRYLHGCRTLVVPDLAEAQALARELAPQLVILDQALTAAGEAGPSAAGEARRFVRELGLPRLPVLTCPLPAAEREAAALEVDGYLTKPVSGPDLWNALRRFADGVARVLVVDDDADFVRLMGRMLAMSAQRYQVLEAYTAGEALTVAQRRRPDLVLLDLGLPDMHGAQIIPRLRAMSGLANVRIIVVSGHDAYDAGEPLHGPITVERAGALSVTEVVHWAQAALDVTMGDDRERAAMSSAAAAAPQAGPAP